MRKNQSRKRFKERQEIVGYIIHKSSRYRGKRPTSPSWEWVDGDQYPEEYQILRSTVYPTARQARKAAIEAKKYNPVGFSVCPMYNPITIVS